MASQLRNLQEGSGPGDFRVFWRDLLSLAILLLGLAALASISAGGF